VLSIPTCSFMSLYQHQAGRDRSDSEELLFKKALGSLSVLYAHQYTRVFRLTAMPSSFPDARPYDTRGCSLALSPCSTEQLAQSRPACSVCDGWGCVLTAVPPPLYVLLSSD